jgi:hypothetical protein
VREYQGVKMSWVELDRIVSEEIARDDGIRRCVAESGRPLRSHATGMSDDDLLAKLCSLGVDADREKLAELCDRALSAEPVVSERPTRSLPPPPRCRGSGRILRCRRAAQQLSAQRSRARFRLSSPPSSDR